MEEISDPAVRENSQILQIKNNNYYSTCDTVYYNTYIEYTYC